MMTTALEFCVQAIYEQSIHHSEIKNKRQVMNPWKRLSHLPLP